MAKQPGPLGSWYNSLEGTIIKPPGNLLPGGYSPDRQTQNYER